MPAIMLIKEDFPTPLFPKTHKILPLFIFRLRFLINGFSFGEFHFNDMLINSSKVR